MRNYVVAYRMPGCPIRQFNIQADSQVEALNLAMDDYGLPPHTIRGVYAVGEES